MSKRLSINETPPARAIRTAALVLALFVINSPAWCQTGGSAETTKDAAKARKEELKEASKAIKRGNIEQLKAILQAHPDIVAAPVPQGILAQMAVAPLAGVMAGGASAADAGRNGAVLTQAAGSNVTLLSDAAYYNQKEAAELLLAYHANVNASTGLGFTPLHDAVMRLSIDVARVLLDHGADVNARARNGDTPLRLLRWEKATRRRNQPLQAFNDFEELLLQHGAQ